MSELEQLYESHQQLISEALELQQENTLLQFHVANLEKAGDRMERAIVACFSSPSRDGVFFECQVCENGFYGTENEIVHDEDCPVTLWREAKASYNECG